MYLTGKKLQDATEALLLSYDQFTEYEEFPIQNPEPTRLALFSDVEIREDDIDNKINLSISMASMRTEKIVYRLTLSIKRTSPIFVDSLKGILIYEIQEEILDEKNFLDKSNIYSNIKDRSDNFFKTMIADKEGYIGELIRAGCDRFLAYKDKYGTSKCEYFPAFYLRIQEDRITDYYRKELRFACKLRSGENIEEKFEITDDMEADSIRLEKFRTEV